MASIFSLIRSETGRVNEKIEAIGLSITNYEDECYLVTIANFHRYFSQVKVFFTYEDLIYVVYICILNT